ncbi:ubiquitin C-terminal hydrolase, putative [Talaromyces stipitatus ATCC 10500]|uniref:Ubiquitin carboxyl-terminal hydrolase n=1 Tax=Talaromyces stipitatus (strain ATCC 10500 / CBS 375.48 / QM 6759 / NRRL 1006) TaxID=441959 RepID=B8LTM0_TALSN|nr:ubiquitin C-terminal hydrolase, putative [Talaromyces stipitatus ATCC 10500]EED23612.1 ubiquitin C-terminal hydrolase, putative [Talaromyces stipitatus ATCC 10500]
MTGCHHFEDADVRPPTSTQPVYREDCTQCFDSIDDPSGLNVCLQCFNGGCTGERNHARLHHARTNHVLALNVRRTRKKVQRDEPPQKISKLAILAETEEDRYDTATTVICYACQVESSGDLGDKLSAVVEGVMKALSFSKREEVKAWEQEFVPCEHTLRLKQQEHGNVNRKDLKQCSMCELKENLWLCLECGNVGCGRSQFGGVGGNSHALAHADSSSHGVAVKLGSITPEGSADIYCYKCNEERIDPNLAAHLAHWGINIAESEKTEKSLMELQVEQNLKWEFAMTSDDGSILQPIFGPGFTGLKNLGNSCYLASIIQCLFALPDFERRYFHPNEEPPHVNNPAEDLETQLRKLADGLLSGRYSKPDSDVSVQPDSPEVPHQRGLAPAMFKHLIGRGHEEFSTMRQQDAFELLLHLFKLITLSRHSESLANPVESFRFVLEQRLQCLDCGKVRYKYDEQDNISLQVPARPLVSKKSLEQTTTYETVTMKECLDIFTGEEVVELKCSGCGSNKGFCKRSRFKSLPQHLVINARRFELINWVPTKLNIPVDISDGDIDMSVYLSPGPLPTEELLPEDSETGATAFTANPELVQQLSSMGFSQVRCENALYATGNSDLEGAMNWLLAHLDDPAIDKPVSQGNVTGADSAEHDIEKIQQLGEMGIDANEASKALSATGGDVNRALDWVFSHPDSLEDDNDMSTTQEPRSALPRETPGKTDLPARYKLQSLVCHKGGSLHAGHYVAFINREMPGNDKRAWVLYNDEKVVKADNFEEMKQFAYVYFLSRSE